MNIAKNLPVRSRKRLAFQRAYSNRALYLMLAPGIVFFFIFSYIPMSFLVVVFQDYKMGLGIIGSKFVGLANFRALFTDYMFPTVLRNTLIINALKIVLCFPMPIMLALCFNELRPSPYKRFTQSIVYLPHFLSWVIVSGIMNSMLSSSSGLVNKLIEALGGTAIPFLSKASLYRTYLVVSDIWKETGWGSIIYIASLASVSEELYEAAIIDGASKWRRIWHVSLPGIRSTMIILFILSTGSLLSNSFEQVFMTRNTAVAGVAEIISTYVYSKGLNDFKISYATTVGLFQSLIGFLLVMASNKMADRFGGSSLW